MEKKYINPEQSQFQGLLLCDSDIYEYFSNHNWVDFLEISSIIKEDKDRTIIQASLLSGSKVFAKIYKEKGIKNIARRMVYGVRAKQSHFRTLDFINYGIATPDSLGYLVRNIGSHKVESIHFCSFLTDGHPLVDVFNDKNISGVGRRRLLVDVARLFSDLHAVGYIHGDAKLTNILYDSQQLYLVDLDGVRCLGLTTGPERDVARLLVGLSELECGDKADRELFFESYCGFSSVDKTKFTKRVMRLVQKFQERHRCKYSLEPVDIF